MTWFGRWLGRGGTFRWHHGNPARADPPAPAPHPVPGTTLSPKSPAPAGHGGHGRRLWTMRKFEDGTVVFWDAAGNSAVLREPDDLDAELRDLTS